MPQAAGPVTVDYEYLTADQCERLMDEVKDAASSEPWGHYDRNGEGDVNWKTIADLETDHLRNILMTQPQIGNRRRAIILAEMNRRNSNQGDNLYKDRTLRRLAYGVIIGVVLSWLVGCSKYSEGDKVCNHAAGLCGAEVIASGGGGCSDKEEWVDIAFTSDNPPQNSREIADGYYQLRISPALIKLHEEDSTPLHER